MSYETQPEARPVPALNLRTLMKTTALTAIYPGAGLATPVALLYVACGLAGEAGETANKTKKIVRDDGGQVTSARREQIVKELGGTFWYWLRLCAELNLDPYEVIHENMKLLTLRAADGTLGGDDRSDGSRVAAAQMAERGCVPESSWREERMRSMLGELAAGQPITVARSLAEARNTVVAGGWEGQRLYVIDPGRYVRPEELAQWRAEAGR